MEDVRMIAVCIIREAKLRMDGAACPLQSGPHVEVARLLVQASDAGEDVQHRQRLVVVEIGCGHIIDD